MPQLELPDCNIVNLSVVARRRRDQVMADALVKFSGAAMASSSSLWLDTLPGTAAWGLEQIYDATRDLDVEGLLSLIAKVKISCQKGRIPSEIPPTAPRAAGHEIAQS